VCSGLNSWYVFEIEPHSWPLRLPFSSGSVKSVHVAHWLIKKGLQYMHEVFDTCDLARVRAFWATVTCKWNLDQPTFVTIDDDLNEPSASCVQTHRWHLHFVLTTAFPKPAPWEVPVMMSCCCCVVVVVMQILSVLSPSWCTIAYQQIIKSLEPL
jgi:hypothetical protein